MLAVVSFVLTVPLEAELVSHWKFDENSGNIAYDSVDNNDGTVYGAQWTIGKINGALEFDGIDNYVDCGNDNSLNLDIGSWGGWFKLNSIAGSSRFIIKSNETGTTGMYELFYNNNYGYNRFDAEILVGSERYTASSPSGVNAGQWYHVFATYDAETLRLYINGQELGVNTMVSGIIDDNTGPLGIGAKTSDPTYKAFGGMIDDVRIYNHVLSQDEIQALVPEPATLSMLILGSLALIRRRSLVKIS